MNEHKCTFITSHSALLVDLASEEEFGGQRRCERILKLCGIFVRRKRQGTSMGMK